jgi:hypothetical protein
MRTKSCTKNNWKKVIRDKIENKINEEKEKKWVMKKWGPKFEKNELKL